MAEGTETHREAVLSDLHVPYHDRWALELVCKILEVVKPTRCVVAGDALDCYQLSAYDKNPDRAEDRFQEELDTNCRYFRLIKSAAPADCEWDFVPGNHEDRLRRFLWRNPALYGLRALDLRELMSLTELGFTYHEYEVELVPKQLVVKHGRYVSRHSAFSGKAELEHEKHSISTITGHTHRLGSHYVRTRRGMVAAWENGCLCSLEPEYIPNPNWQHGFSLVTHNGKDSFQVEQIPLLGEKKRKKAYVWGQEVRL